MEGVSGLAHSPFFFYIPGSDYCKEKCFNFFLSVKHFVSPQETLCFVLRN